MTDVRAWQPRLCRGVQGLCDGLGDDVWIIASMVGGHNTAGAAAQSMCHWGSKEHCVVRARAQATEHRERGSVGHRAACLLGRDGHVDSSW